MSNNKPTLTDQKSKIFPRNLTARAAYVVPGNPVVTRTEDGVDNCYPGLEMDAKNIQKYFMPGLYFEVYSSAGTRLVSLTPSAPNQPWYSAGLKESDTETEKGVYLWAIKGRVAEDQDPADPPITELGYTYNMGGLYGWRMINALFPGKVAIVLGTGTPPDKDSEQWQAIQTLLNKQWQSNKSVVMRDAQGALEQAVIIGDRSNYLNEQGVLDPDVYTPGELTRTLCTPWTYDFRDCQCFYWASNKPDVNASEDGKYEFLNFQRKNYQVEPQTSDIANNYIGRRKRELDYADLMVDWEQLRPVLNGRECGQSYTPEPGPVEEGYWDKAEIIEELTYAASIEHALAVQYLYAYYSINAPTTAPDQNTGKAEVVNIYNAAQIVFNIAVDEMRHLRWANEALRLLGAPATIKRGTKLGRNLQVPFYMASMNSEQLQWFIDVERPSRSTSSGLDGMYTKLLRSIQCSEEIEQPTKRRLVEIMKLIIDEGEGHYERFSNVELNLSIYSDFSRTDLPHYVRSEGQWSKEGKVPDGVPLDDVYGLPTEADTQEFKDKQTLSDAYYSALLAMLGVSFNIDDPKASGALLNEAISVMFKMNAVNFELAEAGYTPLFAIAKHLEISPPTPDKATSLKTLEAARKTLEDLSVDMNEEIGAGPHKGKLGEIFNDFESAVNQHMQ